jgi:phosphatidylinositol alpha-1,6-mannosyltransferase
MSNTPRKWLFITHDFPPNTTGGMTSYYRGLTRHLPPENVAVLTVSAPGSREVDARCSFPVYRSFLSGRQVKHFAGTIFWIVKALHIIRKERITMIHCGNMRPYGYVCAALHALTGVPYLLYFFGNDLMRMRDKMQASAIKRALFGGIVRRAAAVVGCSAFTRDLAMETLAVPASKALVCFPGIDAEFLEQRANAPVIDAGRPLHLITVGRLTPRKGVDRVIEAVGILARQGHRIDYTVVGKGAIDRYQALAREHGVEAAVRFTGYVRDTGDLIRLMMEADIFIMVSRLEKNGRDVEGFGIVYLEAAALMRPCIAGRSGGTVDAVVHGRTGLLVDDPDSAQQIADAIRYFIEQPGKAADFGMEGHRRARAEFAWETIVPRFCGDLRTIQENA